MNEQHCGRRDRTEGMNIFFNNVNVRWRQNGVLLLPRRSVGWRIARNPYSRCGFVCFLPQPQIFTQLFLRKNRGSPELGQIVKRQTTRIFLGFTTGNPLKLQVLNVVHFFNRYSYIMYKIGGKFPREARIGRTIWIDTWVIFSCLECQSLQNHALFRKDYFRFGRDLITEPTSPLDQIIGQVRRQGEWKRLTKDGKTDQALVQCTVSYTTLNTCTAHCAQYVDISWLSI